MNDEIQKKAIDEIKQLVEGKTDNLDMRTSSFYKMLGHYATGDIKSNQWAEFTKSIIDHCIPKEKTQQDSL
jgi:hypothetical protein